MNEQILRPRPADSPEARVPTVRSQEERNRLWRRCEDAGRPFLCVQKKPRGKTDLTLDMLTTAISGEGRPLTPDQCVAVERIFDEVGRGTGQSRRSHITWGAPVRYDVYGFDLEGARALARRIRDEVLTMPPAPTGPIEWSDREKARYRELRVAAGRDGD